MSFNKKKMERKVERKKVICFDLEGPLSPNDFAFELMKLIPKGEKIFSVISRYDDLLTLERKKDYQPGNTLALIVPFLIRAGITEKQIKKISLRTILTEGAEELVEILKKEGWKIYINSTSYRQHAVLIAKRLGVKEKNVFSTEFPLDRFQRDLRGEKFPWVEIAETYISNFLFSENLSSGEKDREIREYLDQFYWPLAGKIEEIVAKVKVNGGERKVETLRKICQRERVKFSEIIVVGDSITDFEMLRIVKEDGGLAIAFNANKYAFPYATVGVASVNLRDIKPILDAWIRTGEIKELIKKLSVSKDPPYYQWVDESDLGKALEYHSRCRKIVRGAITAELG